MSRKLVVELIGDSASLERSLGSAGKATEGFGGRLKSLAKTAAFTAGTAAVGAVTVGLVESVKAGLAAQASMARLQTAFKDVGLSATESAAKVDAAEAAGRRLGFTDDQTRSSLGSLITATGSVKESMSDLAIAEDLARFKSVDLETATKALTMAHAGSTRALKQLGIQITPVTEAVDKLKASNENLTTAVGKADLAHAKLTDKMATSAAAIDIVKQKVEGQGQAFASTAAGGLAQFHATLGHLEEEIGLRLLPIMTSAISWVQANWPQISAVMEQVWVNIKPILVALGDLFLSVVEAVRAHWPQIEPIVRNLGIVIKDVMLIVGGALKLVADLLRGDWSGAWDDARAIVGNAADAIKHHAEAMLAVLRDVFDAVAGVIHGVAHAIGRAVGAVVGALEPIIHVLEDIARAAEDAANAIQKVADVGRAVGGAVGSVTGAIGGAAGSVGKTIGGLIPHAGGGMVVPGQAYLVGERGPEMFTSASAGAIIPNSGLGGGLTVNVTHNGPLVGSGGMTEFAQILRVELLRIGQRNGAILGGFA
jgi:hypothetical protein